MSPVIQPDDPDFIDQEPKKVVIPPSWDARLAKAAKALRCAERSLTVQMVRASMDIYARLGEQGKAPIPEGPELVGVDQDNRYLAPFRWKLIDEEGHARGLSRNKVFQAHFLRGLQIAEAQAEEEKKAKR